MTESIHFNSVIRFTKVSMPYGWLSNMSPHPINYEGKEYRTAEALFQSLRFHDDSIVEHIRSQKSPMGAKLAAKSRKESMVIEPMSFVDVLNMKLVLRLKIEQYPELAAELLKLEDKYIVEDVTNRKKSLSARFWGASLTEFTHLYHTRLLIDGENNLGKLWMDLRDILVLEEYKKPYSSVLRSVIDEANSEDPYLTMPYHALDVDYYDKQDIVISLSYRDLTRYKSFKISDGIDKILLKEWAVKTYRELEINYCLEIQHLP